MKGYAFFVLSHFPVFVAQQSLFILRVRMQKMNLRNLFEKMLNNYSLQLFFISEDFV